MTQEIIYYKSESSIAFIRFISNFSRPQHSEAKPCSNNQSVCEYLEFKNSENSSGFEITMSDEYDDSETTFWNNLISY